MWDWLSENHGPVNAVTGVLTLAVWLLYFQLLYIRYRRSLRPKILITRGGGPHIDAECIVTNMSAEPIYLDSLVLSFHDGLGDTVCSLSDLARDESRSDLRGSTMQGSLGSGEMIGLGSFRHLLQRVGWPGAADGSGELSFSVTVVAIYTAEDRFVAAERPFTVCGDALDAPTISARQIRSRSDRARLEDLIRATGGGGTVPPPRQGKASGNKPRASSVQDG